MNSPRFRCPVARVLAVICLLLCLRPGGVGATEPPGKLTVDDQTIALAHAAASATTMGGDDPVTFVRLTERPAALGSEGDMAAISGEAGAVFAIHLHESGAVFQVLALHPVADPSFPVQIPKEAVRLTGFRLTDGELVATIESDGEVRVDGHEWRFRFELRLPVRPLD